MAVLLTLLVLAILAWFLLPVVLTGAGIGVGALAATLAWLWQHWWLVVGVLAWAAIPVLYGEPKRALPVWAVRIWAGVPAVAAFGWAVWWLWEVTRF